MKRKALKFWKGLFSLFVYSKILRFYGIANSTKEGPMDLHIKR